MYLVHCIMKPKWDPKLNVKHLYNNKKANHRLLVHNKLQQFLKMQDAFPTLGKIEKVYANAQHLTFWGIVENLCRSRWDANQ